MTPLSSPSSAYPDVAAPLACLAHDQSHYIPHHLYAWVRLQEIDSAANRSGR